jgi:GT2 family glycosyltransferase
VKPTLLVVCTHFRDAKTLRDFLERFQELPVPPGWAVEVAVGDNEGTLGDGSDLPACPSVHQTGGNHGYFAGCAVALERWQERAGRWPDYLLVTNTDIELGEDFIEILLGGGWGESVGVLAPHVLRPGSTSQNPFARHRPPRWKLWALRRMFGSSRAYQLWSWIRVRLDRLRARISRGISGRVAAADAVRAADVAAPERIYAPHGCAMLLLPAALEGMGGLRFPSFMFWEEIYVAEEMRRLGLDVLWVPALVVIHREHNTTSTHSREWRRAALAESSAAILRRYFAA